MLLDLQGLKIALNGISTKIDSKISKNQLPKPDWNESNPTHKNFIQNKTHGEIIKHNYLLKNQNFSKIFYEGYVFENEFEIDGNKTYTVKYDDIPYILTPFPDMYGGYSVGNTSPYLTGAFGDKNSEGYIPFVLNGVWMWIDDINSHTVEIIINDENSQVLLEKTQLWFESESFSDSLSEFYTYKIEYDGKIYDNLTLSENNPYLATDDFIIKVNPNTYSFFEVFTLTADIHSFKLYQNGEIIIDTFVGTPAYMRLLPTFILQKEVYYDIVWNNQSYEVIAKSSPSNSDGFYFGNQFLYDYDESHNTGEPFLIEYYPDEIYIYSKDNNINFSIDKKQIEIQQLDPKFIPGALGVVDYEGSVSFGTGKTGGVYSFAAGCQTRASGNYSFAVGENTDASHYAYAEGSGTSAAGMYSHAEGYQTFAAGSSQHVQGEWNIPDQNTSTPGRTLHAHIVGNGTGTDSRSNAHTLDWDGNAWFAGDIYVGSTSGVNKDSGSKKLIATPSDVIAGDLLTYNGTNWVRISRADLIADIIAALPRAEEATF